MTIQRGPEAPRPARGASSWAQRVNEFTVQWLAAYSRIASVVWSLVSVGALFGLVWWPSWNWAGSLATCVIMLAAHVWLGFIRLANPEWRDDGDS